jgi:hypothetical protein
MIRILLLRLATIVLTAIAVFIILSKTAHADPKQLQKYSDSLGVHITSQEPFRAIETAARLYGLDPKQMVAIADVESRMSVKALNVNTNGTRDVGMFQINTVVAEGECLEFNVFTVQGNALCAAKLLKGHKKHEYDDAQWIGRYHSKQPNEKALYVQKLNDLQMKGE